MTSDHRIQKATVHHRHRSSMKAQTSQPSQRLVGGLSRKITLSEKALPPLPDEDQDAGPEADAGTGLSTVDTGSFEDSSYDTNAGLETDSGYSTDMVNDHARSSTNVSTWDYGIYWTRKAYSQDTRDSYRDSMVTRGDVMSFQSRIGGYQSEVFSQRVTAMNTGTTPQDVRRIAMPEDRNSERIYIPSTVKEGLADSLEIDAPISESDYYESSVGTGAISASTDLSTWDYGLYWRRRPDSRSTLPNPTSMTHPQSNFDSEIIHEADDDEEDLIARETSILPIPLPVRAQERVIRKRKVTPVPDNYIPVLDKNAKIKLLPPYEMTRPPPLLQRLFANLATPSVADKTAGSQRSTRRSRRSDLARYPTIPVVNGIQGVKPPRVTILPENYIPVVDVNHIIRLPLPHDLDRMVPFPTSDDSRPIRSWYRRLSFYHFVVPATLVLSLLGTDDSRLTTSWYERRSTGAIRHRRSIAAPENYTPVMDGVQKCHVDIPAPHEIIVWEDITKRTIYG